MLKLYPCMVLKGTKLYEQWKKKEYTPLTTSEAAKIIVSLKKSIPDYVRIMRVQRDIPTKVTEAGVDKNNLRQYVGDLMRKDGAKCRCIRCREIKGKEIKGKVEMRTIIYPASGGTEYFVSFDSSEGDNDSLLGFCRLRFPSQALRKEITADSAIIRELHVYGSAADIGGEGKIQHKGFGKRLLAEAERIAKDAGKKKMIIISGVGVRDYYRKLGYSLEGPYMVKRI